MKTFTTLTAVAALIAGISIASAQTSSQSPASMNKGGDPETKASGSQSGSSAAQQKPAAQQATGSSPFCIEMSKGGAWECKFASLAACEAEGKPNNRACHPNPKGATTGAGGMKQ